MEYNLKISAHADWGPRSLNLLASKLALASSDELSLAQLSLSLFQTWIQWPLFGENLYEGWWGSQCDQEYV